MRFVSLLLVFTFVLGASFSAVNAKGRVGIGDLIPGTLSVKDQNNISQTIETIAGDKGIALVFVRSADWCPYCQAQLIELDKRSQEFTDLGYPIVSISYDSTENLAAFQAKYNTGFTMLSDPESEIIRAFGLLNEEQKPGSFSYGIPHPALYVIGKDKVVRANFFEDDYKERPKIDDVLKEIKSIGLF